MKYVKKLLGIAVLLAVLAGCLIFSVSAAADSETELDKPDTAISGYCGGEGDGTNLQWLLDDDGVLSITGTGSMENWTSYAPWQVNSDSIKTVIIDDGVTTIGNYAFNGCTGFTSVIIGDDVAAIGEYAFQRCAITALALPDSVTTIGNGAFQYCNKLTSVFFGSNVTSIGNYAFRSCTSLTSVKIPNSVTELGRYAFAQCSGLTSVSISSNVTAIGDYTFDACTGLTSVTIPDGVTSIGIMAFDRCSSLTSVTFGSKVASIGTYAFYHCTSLTALELPDSVASIDSRAFYGCKALTSVTVGSGLTSVGSYAFGYCDELTSVYFEGNGPTVGSSAFQADTVTLYYTPGTTGWTDSEAYDAAAGTWNGYQLKAWGAEEEPVEPEEPEVPTVTITDTGRSLSLDDIVYIRQYAKITTELTQEYIVANGGLLVWNSEPAEADIATADDVQEGLVYDDYYGEYTQTTDGIPTKQFADELYMAIYVKNTDGSYVYGPVCEYSVQTYCEGRIANSTNEKMRTLAIAMLHYGAAAQTYFNYNTDDLANANIAATYPADEWDETLLDALETYTTELTGTGDVTSTGKSLALEGQAVMNCYFAADTASEIVSGELQVWDGESELTEDNITYTAEMTYDDYYNEWVGMSNGFVAKEYAKTIHFRAVLTDAEGNVHVSDIITGSPEDYASGRIANSTNVKMVELAKHLVMYGERARLYFS